MLLETLIEQIALTKLQNDQLFSFMTEFKTSVETHNPQTIGIITDYPNFCVLYKQLDDALEYIRKSHYTIKIKEADEVRDNTYNIIKKAINSKLTHYDQAIKEAAYKINIVVKTYGNVVNDEYSEETGKLINFIAELRDHYNNEINTLNISRDINKLETDNTTFMNLIAARDAQIAEKITISVKDARKAIQNYYNDPMILRINAIMILQPTAVLTNFISIHNATIKRYNLIIAKHEGTNAAKRNKNIQSED